VEQVASRGCRTKEEYQQRVALHPENCGFAWGGNNNIQAVMSTLNTWKSIERSLLSKAGHKRPQQLENKRSQKPQPLADFRDGPFF
jgi:hypothetical protein